MNTKPKLIGIAIATSAAIIFVSVSINTTFAQPADKITCYGSNSCKGHGACKTATSSCRGQNACKGQGITYENGEHDCLNAGGTTKTY